MGGRGLGGLLAMAALSGCSLYFGESPDAAPPDTGTPDALDYAATLDVDVVLHAHPDGDRVVVYLAEVDRPCYCPSGGFPHVEGSCTGSSDGGGCQCDPVPAACLQSLTIERDGQIAAFESPVDWDPTLRWAWIPGTGSSAVLHLRGCGAQTDLVVPVGPFPDGPVLGDLVGTESGLHVSWANDPPPIHEVVTCSWGLGGPICHEVDGQIDFEPGCEYLSAYTVVGDAVATDHGEIRVWQGSRGYGAHLYYPQEIEPGRWSVGTGYDEVVSVQTASDPETMQVFMATVDLASEPLDASLRFDAGGLHYTAGPADDTIEWRRNWRTCTATVPHLVPSVPIAPGDPYPTGPFELALPPTTLACDIDGPLSLAFDLSWDLGVIVRPE